jgi:hypothetical protein
MSCMLSDPSKPYGIRTDPDTKKAPSGGRRSLVVNALLVGQSAYMPLGPTKWGDTGISSCAPMATLHVHGITAHVFHLFWSRRICKANSRTSAERRPALRDAGSETNEIRGSCPYHCLSFLNVIKKQAIRLITSPSPFSQRTSLARQCGVWPFRRCSPFGRCDSPRQHRNPPIVSRAHVPG